MHCPMGVCGSNNFRLEASVNSGSQLLEPRASAPYATSACCGSTAQRGDDVVESAQQVVVGDDVHYVHILALDHLQVKRLMLIDGCAAVSLLVAAHDKQRLGIGDLD